MKNTRAAMLTPPARGTTGAHAADANVGRSVVRAPAPLSVNASAAPGPEA